MNQWTMNFKVRRFVRTSSDGKHEDWVSSLSYQDGNLAKHVADVIGSDRGSRVVVDISTMWTRWTDAGYAMQLIEVILAAESERAAMAAGNWKADEAKEAARV